MIVSNLKKQLGGKEVLQDVTFTLSENDKVGLVGVNGSGKSTLLKVLSGQLEADSGSIKLGDKTIGYLKQEISYKYNDLTILEYIEQETGIAELETRLHALEDALNDANMDEYSDVLNRFLVMDGYSFEDNLKEVLAGLKLHEDLSSKIGTLSGGEKIKVLLATLLLTNNDVLLLDEPTNNLDVEAIEWLESYLKNSNKEMIIVSHDEVFLNTITSKIFELSDGSIKEYNLSYSDYLKLAHVCLLPL